MTKKDFELVARAIRTESNRELPDLDQCYRNHQAIKRMAETMADTLKSDNPRFNRVIFLAACGHPPKA